MSDILNKALAPFTLKGFYLLTWGAALGTNIWHSASAYKAFSTLDRKNFSTLQSGLQPLYFAASTALTGGLLAAHLYFHPGLLSAPFRAPHWWQLEEGVQGLLILGALVPQLLNAALVGPAAAHIKEERARREANEGKPCTAANAMAALNARFASLHGLASSLNMGSLLALVGLGLAVSM